MTSKKRLVISGIIFFICTLPLQLYFYKLYKNENFSCDTTMTVKTSKLSLHSVMHYSFLGGQGSVNTTGTVTEPGGQVRMVRRNFLFHYWIVDDNIFMESDEFSDNPFAADDSDIIVPDFYRFRGRALIFTITHQNTLGYLFSQDGTPLFYCVRSDKVFPF